MDGFPLPVKQLKGTDPVESIDLSGKGLGVASAVVIGTLIRTNGSVTSVSLLANNFDDETVSMLLKLKEEKPTLTTLCGLKPDQTEADFTRFRLGPSEAKLLAPEISAMGELTTVWTPAH